MKYYEERVIKVIREKTGLTDIVFEDMLELLGIDSLGKAEIIFSIEDEFGILFDFADLDPAQINKVKDIVRMVERYI